MQEDATTEKLIRKMTMQLGLLTAENLELNVIIEELREENQSLRMSQDVNRHIEQMTQEDSEHE